jgi:elongation factor G
MMTLCWIITFIRVYSGGLNRVHIFTTFLVAKKERVSRLLKMHANKREEIPFVEAGDSAAVVGIKEVMTGDSLADEVHPIILETITALTLLLHISN